MSSSVRWTWCFFFLLAAAAGFPLLPLSRFVILHASMGDLYLPLKILFLMLVILTGGLAAFFLVYGQTTMDMQKPRSPAPVDDALTLGWSKKSDWIRLSNLNLQYHTLILGSSGSGKTQLLLSLLAQQIQRGGGCLMIDAKVDKASLQTVLALCREADRMEDLRVLWPPEPNISHTWNPLLRGRLQEILSRVMALWGATGGKGEGDFWRGQANTALHAILGAMIRIEPLITFNDLYVALTSATALLWLERTCPAGTEEHSALATFLANYRNQKGQLDIERMKKMVGGAPSYVSAYAWGELGRIMNHTRPSLDLLDALMNGRIVYVALPILAETETATAMARMLIADLKQAVGMLQQRNDRPRIPYLVLMDEASAYMNVDGIERLFEQARSAGVGLVAAAQVASGFSIANKQQQDFIFGNCSTKVIMKVGDFVSAETMAKTIGEELAVFASTTTVTTKSRSSAWVSPLPDRSNKGLSESRGSQERYDYVVRPEKLMNQKTGQAVIYIQDPEKGAQIDDEAQLVYLDLPEASHEELKPAPRNNLPGLNLINALAKMASATNGTLPGTGEGPKKATRRPPDKRQIQKRETADFTVAGPKPARPPEGDAEEPGETA
jgi:intracellular multiplication protein IcmO